MRPLHPPIIKIKERYSALAAILFLFPAYLLISILLLVLESFIPLNGFIWLVAIMLPILVLSKINQHVQLTCNQKHCHGDLIEQNADCKVCNQCGKEYRYESLN